MFVCCHPVIPPEAQVALALNTLMLSSTGVAYAHPVHWVARPADGVGDSPVMP